MRTVLVIVGFFFVGWGVWWIFAPAITPDGVKKDSSASSALLSADMKRSGVDPQAPDGAIPTGVSQGDRSAADGESSEAYLARLKEQGSASMAKALTLLPVPSEARQRGLLNLLKEKSLTPGERIAVMDELLTTAEKGFIPDLHTIAREQLDPEYFIPRLEEGAREWKFAARSEYFRQYFALFLATGAGDESSVPDILELMQQWWTIDRDLAFLIRDQFLARYPSMAEKIDEWVRQQVH